MQLLPFVRGGKFFSKTILPSITAAVLFFYTPLSVFAQSSSQLPSVSEGLDVDPITGTSVISIPVQVPQGRGGIQPGVSFLYNSSSPNGPLGPGWVFELGSIERNPKEGTPKYDSSDRFIFMQAGGREELVDSGNGIDFMTKIEGGFSKYKYENNAWTVLDKKGIKYFFGADDDSRVRDPADTSKVFKWCLNRVEDLHGNYMTITYQRDSDHLYPQEINYTGNTAETISPYAKVIFSYESRSDHVITYIGGFRDQLSLRLANVEVTAETSLLTKYVFSYNESQWLNRSVLQSVTQYGSDGTSALPATVFTYSGEEFQVDGPVNLANYPNIDISDNKSVHLMDMNRDGLVDIVKTTPGTGDFKIYFNTSTESAIDFAPPVDAVNSPTAGLENPSMHILDFNGDGSLDIIKGDGCPWYIWINNGVDGYEPAQTVQYQCPASPTSSYLIQFMDMNGDSNVDVLQSYTDGNFRFFASDGNHGLGSPVSAANSPPVGANSSDLKYGDFNGDGLLDIIYGTSSEYKIYLNNGVNGYEPPKTAANRPSQALSDDGIELADMNGDGLTDIIRTDSSPTTRPPLYIYYNNGKTDFDAGTLSYASPELGFQSPHVKLADMNNDGLIDAYVGTPSQGWYTYLNTGVDGFLGGLHTNFEDPAIFLDDNNFLLVDLNGDGQLDKLHGKADAYRVWLHRKDADSSKPNVLVKVANGMGGETLLQYRNARVLCVFGPQYKVAYYTTFFNTVKSVIKKSLFSGETYQTSYEFKKCAWDRDRRELLGFRFAKITDSLGNYTETDFFQQDTYRKGKVLEQRSYDSSGNLLSKTANTWSTHDITYTTDPQVKFIFLSRKDNYVYDGDATGRRTAEEYFYEETPQLGNLTRVVQLGEVDLTTGADIGSDKRTVETSYLNNTADASRLIGLPKQVVIKNNADTTVRQSWFYYDNHTLEELPVKGLLTKKEDWNGDAVGGAANPKTQYAYDTVGNLLSTTDAKNNTTSIAYDSALKLFPLATTNAISHQVNNEYYGINGVALSDGEGYQGLWGQLKSTTDPNNQQGKRVYDVFGRMVKSVSPLDSFSYPTTTVQYTFGGQYTSVLTQTRINHNQSATIDAIEYYDGLGRLVQSKTKSENAGEYVVSGQAEYDSRGLPVKKYLPYFTTNDFNTIDAVDTGKPHSVITYDAAGRVVQSTNPDGTYANVIYDDWTTAAINESGHQQKSYADAYGRLIKKEEYTGADGRDPEYPFAPFTLYASTLYSYDSEGNLLQTTDADNNITSITYDNLGRKTGMNDPDMGVWQYAYDLNGNLVSQTDAKGKEITFTYDALNRLTNKTDGLGLNVNYTYDDPYVDYSKGRLTKAQYSSEDTQFAYDSIGREIESVKKINSASYPVARSYDALSRLVDLEYPDASKIKYIYNDAGQIEQVMDTAQASSSTPSAPGSGAFQADFTAFTEVDPYEDVSLTTNCVLFDQVLLRNSNTFAYHSYPAQGDFVHKFDTIITYSEKWSGELLVWGLSDTPSDTFEDWANGVFVAAVRDGSVSARTILKLGNVDNGTFNLVDSSGYIYDGNRSYLTVQRQGSAYTVNIYSDSARTVLVDTLTMNWTAPGSLNNIYGISAKTISTTIKKMSGDTCSLVYEDVVPPAPVLNPVVSGSGKADLSWADVDFQHGYKVHYGTASGSYSNTIDVGDMTSFTVGGLDNGTPYYFAVTAYNALRESAYSNESSGTPAGILYAADVDYNAQGQITRLEFGNGNVTTYTYDPLTLRLTNLSTQDPALSTIQDLSYTYDAAGNILSITDAVNTDDQTFEYDALSRLIAAQGSYGSKTYVYDEVGNIVQKDGLSYTYGGAGGPHAVTALSDGTTFGYDANGNMTSKIKGADTTLYLYDAENRLVEIKLNGATQATYEYDGDGGRTKKTKYAAGQPVETTKFIGSLYEERNSAWTTFIYLGDQKIAANVDGQIVYYHANHLGSTNLVTDTTGVLKELIEYDPYGKFSRQEKFGGEEDFAWHYFTAQRFDAESGLYYYGARYYDPSLGRFITPDTVVPYASDPQSFNRYSYVRNNPVNLVDPTGHFWFIAAIIGAIVGGVSAHQNDQPIWQGILVGAVSGAILGGAGGALSGAVASGSISLGTAVAGMTLLGSAVGAGGAAIMGGDPGIGAIVGGIGSGIGFGLGHWAAGWNSGSFWGGLGAAAIAGGVASGVGAELAGGSFGSGAGLGAAYAAAGFLGARTLNTLASTRNSDSASTYKKLAYEYREDELMRMYNDARSNPAQKAVIAQAITKSANESQNVILKVVDVQPQQSSTVNTGASQRNYWLIAQGAGEMIGGIALQVASLGLLAPSGGVSAAGISGSVGIIGTGLFDVFSGWSGGPSAGELIHHAVYGVKQESGLLYPYIKLQTGDIP